MGEGQGGRDWEGWCRRGQGIFGLKEGEGWGARRSVRRGVIDQDSDSSPTTRSLQVYILGLPCLCYPARLLACRLVPCACRFTLHIYLRCLAVWGLDLSTKDNFIVVTSSLPNYAKHEV
jgi:hypothetical protein